MRATSETIGFEFQTVSEGFRSIFKPFQRILEPGGWDGVVDLELCSKARMRISRQSQKKLEESSEFQTVSEESRSVFKPIQRILDGVAKQKRAADGTDRWIFKSTARLGLGFQAILKEPREDLWTFLVKEAQETWRGL